MTHRFPASMLIRPRAFTPSIVLKMRVPSMSISVSLIAFGVRYVLDVPMDDIVHAIEARMTDHSHAYPRLARANDRAWQAVGLALAGDGLFGASRTFSGTAI